MSKFTKVVEMDIEHSKLHIKGEKGKPKSHKRNK